MRRKEQAKAGEIETHANMQIRLQKNMALVTTFQALYCKSCETVRVKLV